jgi:hypothetical protein
VARVDIALANALNRIFKHPALWRSYMLARLKNWLNDKFSSGESTSADRLKKNGPYVAAHTAKDTEPKPAQKDTGTHDSLEILDDSLVDPDEEAGIDPYNTGGFDRSKNWNNSFRK